MWLKLVTCSAWFKCIRPAILIIDLNWLLCQIYPCEWKVFFCVFFRNFCGLKLTTFSAWSKCLKPDILITQFYRWFVSNLALSVSVCSFVFFEFIVLFLCFFVFFVCFCVFSWFLCYVVFWFLCAVCGWQPHTLTSATGNKNFFSAKNCTSPLVVQHQAFTFSWVFSKFLCMIY